MTNSNRRWMEPPIYQSPDGVAVKQTSLDALNMEKVGAHIETAASRHRLKAPTDPLEYLLYKQCVVEIEGELLATVAGILCFGHNPQAFFPRAVVDIGHYYGLQPIAYELMHLEKDIGGTLFDQIARVENYIWLNIHHGMTLNNESSQRVEVHQYPFAAIRELGVNMLAHRDYTDYLSAARVHLFRDRIEWINPGGLPNGITVENILDAQSSRNPIIISMLYEAGYVEAFGQGLDTVFSVLEDEELPPPQFHDKGAFFIASVYGRSPDAVSTPFRLKPAHEQIIALLRQNGPMAFRDFMDAFGDRAVRSVQRDLKELQDAGLVRHEGAGRAARYHLTERT